eukprot:Pgem_evm1s18990
MKWGCDDTQFYCKRHQYTKTVSREMTQKECYDEMITFKNEKGNFQGNNMMQWDLDIVDL